MHIEHSFRKRGNHKPTLVEDIRRYLSPTGGLTGRSLSNCGVKLAASAEADRQDSAEAYRQDSVHG
jgi:hypothetical protein